MILRKGYHVIRKDRNASKRRGGVLIALRKESIYSRITVRHPLNWKSQIPKRLWFVYVIDHLVLDLNEWLELFTTFLEETSHSDKILLTGDFNFPDLT